MTDDVPPITHLGFISMNVIPAGTDLVEEVRALNAAGVEVPWMWVLSEERLDFTNQTQASLGFGVHNEVGMLQWRDSGGSFVPATGTNPEWVSYWLAGFHESPVRPCTEVPVEIALTAAGVPRDEE
ncbi:hypothetical protein [Actinokineospora globicatena]|uniref:Uncharacterized protein n=1 Tax=Actinokineospora globicatena TaxID=103729 RepID=A0A9W6QP07_9PSEU|nr:hypothetical protein [Actinokineospora globicatena]GLW91989.1 hypothetical protein Aglo03_28050 [Actinokineospora globicatena]